MHRCAGRRALVLLLCLVALAACGGDDSGSDATDDTRPPTETSAPTTTTSTTPTPDSFERLEADPDQSPEEQVEAAYLHHWDVVLSAFAHGDDEVLDLVLTGEALQVRSDQLAYLLAQDQSMVGTVDHDVVVEIVSESEARVVDDETSHLVTLDAEGNVVDDDAGAQLTNEYTLVLQDGAWLVAAGLRTG